MTKTKWSIGLTGAFLSAGLLFAGPAVAATSGSTGASGSSVATTINAKGASFLQAKLALEMALSKRQGQLTNLTAQVNGAMNLTASDRSALSGRLSSETANIDGLITKVPSDTTSAELHADSDAMYRDNRVFAVMTPQAHDSIVADNNTAMATTLSANETAMSSGITARAAETGYAVAMRQYSQYVKLVSNVHTNATNLDTLVLAQSPAGYPKNLHTFAVASRSLSNEQSSLATSAGDAASIDLFIEAYPVA